MRILAPALLLLALAAPARAQSVADRLADLQLATRVRLALLNDADAAVRAADVDVTAHDGQVTLAGAVSSPSARARAAVVAEDVAGVRAVENALAVGEAARTPEPRATSPDRTASPDRAAERPAPSRSSAGATYHTVRQGDTLYGLARRYGTTVAAIKRLNGLTSDVAPLGRRLRVE